MLRKAFFDSNILRFIGGGIYLLIGVLCLFADREPDMTAYRQFELILIPVLCFGLAILQIYQIAQWLVLASRLEETEPDIKRGLLESAELSFLGLYFLYDDKLITLRRPAIVYYSDVASVRKHHFHRKKGGTFHIIITGCDGIKNTLVFQHGTRERRYPVEEDVQRIISYMITRNPEISFTEDGN